MNSNQSDDKLKLAYIIPNIFTASSAFLGIVSIILASKGEFSKAAIFIFLSLVFDGLDGRVARLTKTTSRFGVEFDSLADLVAFGVAPAMLFYFSFGHDFARVGVLLTALYVVFGAIRLARFNVVSSTGEPSVFIGVPIPTAAIFVTIWVLIFRKYSLEQYSFFLLFLIGSISILMVSNLRYPSFKKIDTKKSHMVRILILFIILFSFIYLYPIETLTIMTTSYVLYGGVRGLYRFCIVKFKKKKV